MKRCPILLAGAMGTMVGETDCIKENCELWIEERCVFKGILLLLEEIAKNTRPVKEEDNW